MENPFTVKSFPEEKHPRNAFDLGRRSVFTSDFFKIYPYFVQEVLPDDDFEIDPRVGIRAMPTQFPIQTKIRMSTEFYYVRNRTLDDGWEDRIFKNKQIEMPWLKLNNDRAKKMISTGSLGDALGVPTTIGSAGFFKKTIPIGDVQFFGCNVYSDPTNEGALTNLFTSPSVIIPYILNRDFSDYGPVSGNPYYGIPKFSLFGAQAFYVSDLINSSDTCDFVFGSSASVLGSNSNYFVAHVSNTPKFSGIDDVLLLNLTGNTGYYSIYNSAAFSVFINSHLDGGYFMLCFCSLTGDNLKLLNLSNYPSVPSVDNNYVVSLYASVFGTSVVDATDDDHIASNPFVGDNPDIRLNALSFRAYEQVCNYYYRSDRNNPYILNGEPQYNEFIPTHDPGPDTNEYDFHYRNWEMDRFVSALQTPQMGDAPLVGVIFTGQDTAKLTFSGSLDGGESQDFDVTVGIDEDDNISQILDFPEEMPSADLQKLLTKIQAGFSINQFRVTNSFQRFLENSLFRGRRYRNQMKSHFGVKVDYPDIDVPQYIGGASSVFDVGQVTNTADSPNAGLGDYVGTLAGGVSSRTIRMSCKEHGFIIGVVSFAPIPSYSQSIAKHLIKSDALDYFSPEFGKIGFVPIRYSELSPLQTEVGQDVHDVFGYQKAHYDYMQALDEVHGDFRTTLRQFVCTRTFASRPQLSASFIEGRPEQLNDIFVAENIADDKGSSAKFLCSSDVSCKVLRQIPIIGTPSLE